MVNVADTTLGDPEAWTILNDPGAGDFAGPSGGQFIQSLPDDGNASPTPRSGPPYVEYFFQVTGRAQGAYQIWTRSVGPDSGGDSLHFQVRDLSTSALLLDSTDFGIGGNGVWETGTWTDGLGPTPFLTTGNYSVRIAPREDGSAVDKVVFQLDSLPAPSGFGPAVSSIVPEPATGAVLFLGATVVLGTSRRRRPLGP